MTKDASAGDHAPPTVARRSAVAASTERADGVPLEVHIDPPSVARLCVLTIALLCGADLLMQWFRLEMGHEYVWGLVRLFDLNEESNAPTWFSSVLLLASAASLWVIAAGVRRARGRFLAHWAVLAAGFTFMSLDETARIHDAVIGQAIEDRFHPSGYGIFFVVPGAIIALAVLLSYLSFLRHLTRRFRFLFVAAGVLYVGGAVGMESVGGAVIAAHGFESWPAQLCLFAEETLEMVGLALFLYALLVYLGQTTPRLAVRVTRRDR